ncbi:MAG: selenium cofactor biosynthesis protein YqeC [Spirochaetota bacterium]
MDEQIFTLLEQAGIYTYSRADSAAIVSVVGAGGKTSVLYAAARGWKKTGQKGMCIVTTTTQMYHPEHERSLRGFPFDGCQTLSSLKYTDTSHPLSAGGTAFLFGRMHENQEKVYGIQPEDILLLAARDDTACIIAEADGANKLPVKAPADYEPVHPPHADAVIGVVGLSVLGKPFHPQWVHRIERMKLLLEHPDHKTVSADMIAELVTHPAGLFKDSPAGAKRILLLNQADVCTSDEISQLRKLFAPQHLGIDGLIIASLKPELSLIYSTLVP